MNYNPHLDFDGTFGRTLESEFSEICPDLGYPEPPSSTLSSSTRATTETYETEATEILPIDSIPFGGTLDQSKELLCSISNSLQESMGYSNYGGILVHFQQQPTSGFQIESRNMQFSFDTTFSPNENSSSISFDQETFSSKDNNNFVKEDSNECSIVGRIYNYPDDETNNGPIIGYLKIKTKALDCYAVSKSIRRSIKDELNMEKKYQAIIRSGKTHLFKERPRKRRNPSCDRLAWEPLSLFTAFTNYKTAQFEKTNYFENIPHTSCFGKINMRMNRAWSRGPNKSKKSKTTHKISFSSEQIE